MFRIEIGAGTIILALVGAMVAQTASEKHAFMTECTRDQPEAQCAEYWAAQNHKPALKMPQW